LAGSRNSLFSGAGPPVQWQPLRKLKKNCVTPRLNACAFTLRVPVDTGCLGRGAQACKMHRAELQQSTIYCKSTPDLTKTSARQRSRPEASRTTAWHSAALRQPMGLNLVELLANSVTVRKAAFSAASPEQRMCQSVHRPARQTERKRTPPPPIPDRGLPGVQA